MVKIVLLAIAVIYLLFHLSRVYVRKPLAPRAPEAIIQCAYCGVYVSQAEAMFEGDSAYCCESHRAQDVRQ